MTEIENFIRKVEAEVNVASESEIFPPDPKRERPAVARLAKKFPELNIDVNKEVKILTHARLLLNSQNN